MSGLIFTASCGGGGAGGIPSGSGGREDGGQSGGAGGGNHQGATGGDLGATGGNGGAQASATGGAFPFDGGARDAAAGGEGGSPLGSGGQGGAVVSKTVRVAINNDGNSYDTDDWGATALIGALVARATDKVQLVHWGYNDNVTKTTSNGEAQMSTSVNGVVTRFALDASVVCDFRKDMSGCVKHLTSTFPQWF